MTIILNNKTILNNRVVINDPWTPLLLPGIVGWWQVDETEQGLTITEASINPDLSAWSHLRLASSTHLGDGVYRLLDQVDESSTNHQLYLAATNVQNGVATFGVTVVGVGGGVDFLSLRMDNDAKHTGFDLINHTRTSSTSGYVAHRIYEIPGVGWRYEVTMLRANAGVFKFILGKNLSYKYQGDGTGYVDLRDVTVTQRIITQCYNRIENGPSLIPREIQTAPKLYDTRSDTWTGADGFYCNELEGLRESELIGPLFTGTNIPFQVYNVCRGQTGVDGGRIYAFEGTLGYQGIYQHNINTEAIRVWRSSTTVSANITAYNAYPVGTRVAHCDYFDGSTRTFSAAGVTQSVNQEVDAQILTRFGWGSAPGATGVTHPLAGNFNFLVLATEARVRGDIHDLAMRRWISRRFGVEA